MNTKSHAELVAALHLASSRLMDAQARGLSLSTLNKRYRELFAAEDAVKAADRGTPWGA